jgi:hypothetical protein
MCRVTVFEISGSLQAHTQQAAPQHKSKSTQLDSTAQALPKAAKVATAATAFATLGNSM